MEIFWIASQVSETWAGKLSDDEWRPTPSGSIIYCGNTSHTNVSGIKPEPLFHAHGFVGQEFKLSTREKAWLCYTRYGASAGKTWIARSPTQLKDGIIWRLLHSCVWLLGWDDLKTVLSSGYQKITYIWLLHMVLAFHTKTARFWEGESQDRLSGKQEFQENQDERMESFITAPQWSPGVTSAGCLSWQSQDYLDSDLLHHGTGTHDAIRKMSRIWEPCFKLELLHTSLWNFKMPRLKGRSKCFQRKPSLNDFILCKYKGKRIILTKDIAWRTQAAKDSKRKTSML